MTNSLREFIGILLHGIDVEDVAERRFVRMIQADLKLTSILV